MPVVLDRVRLVDASGRVIRFDTASDKVWRGDGPEPSGEQAAKLAAR